MAESRVEDLLETGVEQPVVPMSEIEAILRGEPVTPHSRIAELLLKYNPSDILIEKRITENGTYFATNDDADGYYKVVVDEYVPKLIFKEVTANGTYDPAVDGADGYSSIRVNLPLEHQIGEVFNQNGLYHVTPSQGYEGISRADIMVQVNPVLETKSIDDNGTYTPSQGYDGFSSVTVAVPKGSNANITLHCQGLGGGTVTITATNSGQTYTHTNSITTDDEDTTFSNLEYVGNWTVTNSKDSSTLTVNNSAVEADLKLLTPSIPKMISATLPKGEVSCSSSLDSGTYALFAVDKHMSDTGSQYYGNPNIGWQGNDSAPWIKYEFDDPVFFNKLYFRLHSRWDSSWAWNRSYTWSVEGSNDDITYETVLASGDATVSQYKSYDYWWIFDLALNGKKYKYLRLSTNHSMYSRDYWNENMLDLQLYSDPNALPTGALTATENGTYDPEDYDLSAFSSVTVNVSSGGDNPLKGMLERTVSVIDDSVLESIGHNAFNSYTISSGSSVNLTDVTFRNVTSIGQTAFFNCSSLTDADFPNVIVINGSAFYNCSSLTDINFPNAEKINGSAFYNCSSLTDINFPNATTIGVDAFRYCSSLTDINFPNATTIDASAFYNCSSLTEADFPNVTKKLGNSAFYGCSSLTDINFPNVTTLGGSVFYNCSSLTEADFPNVTSTDTNIFYNCAALTSADFSNLTKILGGTFYGCTSLDTLILRKSDSITTLAYTSVFTNTPFASGGTGGTLYVPQALISSYQRASNWTTILGYPNNQIKPIEGSIYE